MNEAELRSLVRTAVARHLGHGTPVAHCAPTPQAHQPTPLPLLSSNTLYAGLVNLGDACVIEPAVKCDHCGFCKSHGY